VTSDAPGAAPDPHRPTAEPRDQLADEVVLVTGFPGFRARALVDLLAEREPKAHVWLVVPPAELEAAARALASTPISSARLRLIPGEPCAIDLGLSRQTYAELCARVDRWFALYQTTDVRASRELANRVNVGSAREIAELAKAAQNLAHVTFLSSAIVFGNHQGEATEEALSVGQSFHSQAAESLARAEALLQRRLAEAPVSVVRTPQVLGARGVASSVRATGLHRLLALVSAAPGDSLPLPPGSGRLVQALPADFVAQALYAVSLFGTRGRAYHFADPEPPALGEVLEQAAAHFGKRLEPGAGALGRLLLNNPGFWLSQQSARALSEWAEGPTLATRSGDRLLERAGLRAPTLLSYLGSVLQETELLERERLLDGAPLGTPFEAVA
jgi:nucleoside-diphosphate-sugar epimerase